MSAADDVGERIEALLTELDSAGDPAVGQKAEELVRAMVEFYGSGLERIIEITKDRNPGLIDRFAADELVAGLLVLHDLHPQSTEERVAAALEKVRPYLGSHAGDVEYLGIAPDGVLRLRLAGSCNGCPSSTVTVKLAIEQAVRESAPEITGVEVEGVAPPPGPTGPGGRPLLPLVTNGAPPPPPPQPAKGRWVELAGFAELPLGSVAASRIDSTVAVVCNVNGGLYAYQDGCSACHASLAPGLLEGKVITCPSCGERYDAVLAGRSIRDGGPHLDPLPLLSDGGKIRIAVAS